MDREDDEEFIVEVDAFPTEIPEEEVIVEVDALPQEPTTYSSEEFEVEIPEEPQSSTPQRQTYAPQLIDFLRVEDDIIDLDAIREEYGRPFLKEDFLEDERLQEVVYQSLEARRRGTTSVGRGASAVLGAATFGPQDIRQQPFEEVFETWQNYQRSFDAGQSITTANEIAHTLGEDEETAARLGAGYLAFEYMDNAITGAGSWSEAADAVADYTRAVVWDPATLLTFGIGKALSGASTRLATTSARNLMMRAYRRALSRNVAGRAALATIGASARAAPFIAPDLAFNVGSDVAQQFQLIRTGAQEEYEGSRTALAAAGTMAIPALMAGMKGVAALRRGALRDTAFGASDFDFITREVSQDVAWEMSMQRVNRDNLIDSVDDNFGRIQGDPSTFLNWENAKIVAGEVVSENGERLTDDRIMNMFEKYFWFGSRDEESTGYFNTLKDAGFVVHPSMLEDNKISNVYGQAITFLTDESTERIIRQFEEVTGRQLGITPTADGLASHFINRSNTAGETLSIRSQLSRLERQGLTGEELLRAATGTGEVDASPDVFRFGLSVYKRLLTSHLSTTGANLKGFAQLVTLNTAADLFSSAVYTTQRGVYGAFGNADEAARYARLARASFRSPGRRVAGALSPDLDMEYANLVLEQNPEMLERLFRDISGDSGSNRALADANIDPENRLASTVDGITRGAQTLTLVQLQDDLTKRWAFASNLDREIDRTYGVTATEFWRREDVALEQRSEKFQEVLERAVYRTQRETASVNWTSLPANNVMRNTAAAIEDGINRRLLGGAGAYIAPFTAFMNTTLATMGDLTGFNAGMRILGVGRKLDYASQDFGELAGKAFAGWSFVLADVPNAIGRVQSGLSWNQEETDTGAVIDRTYDWPDSTMRLMSQIIAHSLVGDVSADGQELARRIEEGRVRIDMSQVPGPLLREFGLQLGPGAAIRDFDGALQAAREMLEKVVSGEASLDDWEEFGLRILTKPVQGLTRPLDPINMAVGIARDGNMNPDLRQGSEVINQAFRYINQLIPEVSNVDNLPRRAMPLTGTDRNVDIARQLLGNRMSDYPNIAEAMHNAAGVPSWDAITWNGPPEVKNFMDGLAAPIFERESLRALQSNPDYFDMTTDQKERILEGVRGRVRETVMDIMQTSGTPRTLDAARRLSISDKAKVTAVMDWLGYEGDISDVLQGENAFEDLSRIQYFVDNYDSFFFGDLNLDQ